MYFLYTRSGICTTFQVIIIIIIIIIICEINALQ